MKLPKFLRNLKNCSFPSLFHFLLLLLTLALYSGVKQIMITGGTLAEATKFDEESRFKGEIYFDSSVKIHQLFQMRARKQSTRTLYSTKMQVIRSKVSDRLELKPEKGAKVQVDKEYVSALGPIETELIIVTLVNSSR